VERGPGSFGRGGSGNLCGKGKEKKRGMGTPLWEGSGRGIVESGEVGVFEREFILAPEEKKVWGAERKVDN